MKLFLLLGLLAFAWLGHAASPAPAASEGSQAPRPPNVVIILADDQGYADIGCYGAKGFSTRHLDRMAAEGLRFTDFYVAQAPG
jgi:hypothetical protein